ncbi:MAG: hypothetical protein WCF98_02940 [Synechococcus sp. ELA057]|jgi:ElaB/YqjD/DUF883 family membrane-anchored ribosome-binding protein
MDPETASFSPASPPDSNAAEPVEPDASPVPGVFRERFESLLPRIQKQWPDVARQTLEASRGSFETVVDLISRQSGSTTAAVRQQLTELLHVTTEQASQMAENLRPLEEQLEGLLDELNATLRPRIEKPVREKPLLALGIAAGLGLVVGLLLSSGRRSA